MRRTIRLTAVLLAIAVTTALVAQNPDSVQIETVAVAPGLSMLVGSGGNIGVLTGADGTLVIDDEYAPLAPKIHAAIHALSGQPIRFLVNTHWHGDHTGGNLAMHEAGAIIVAHENVRKRMSVDQFNAVFKRTTPASPEAALPVVTFSDGVTFWWNGNEVRVIHVKNAHTDGDAVIYFPQLNVIHLGDVFFHGLYPFIDKASGGSMDGMIAAVDQVLPLINDSTRVIPGHGPLGTRADLLEYRKMMTMIRDRLKAATRKKLTLDQVLATQPTREFDEQWGHGFLTPDDFVTIVYSALTVPVAQ